MTESKKAPAASTCQSAYY